MDYGNIVTVIGGLGLFIFAQRILTQTLDNVAIRRITPILVRFVNGPWQCLGLGFVMTILWQLSNATVNGATALLAQAVISLDQAILMMLGASLGTTMKFWIIGPVVHLLGPLLIGLSSVLGFSYRAAWAKRLWETLFAIGLFFLALDLTSKGFLALYREANIAGFLAGINSATVLSVLSAVIVGTLLSMIAQSSSAVIFVLMQLSVMEQIPIQIAVAIVLGANVGSSVMGFFNTLQYHEEARRLAIANIVAKVVGVMLTLMFFRGFVVLLEELMPGTATDYASAWHVAGAHSLFNGLIVVVWGGLHSLLAKIVVSKSPQEVLIVSTVLQRILAKVPERAIFEVERQVRDLVPMMKHMTDTCFQRLLTSHADSGKASLKETLEFRKSFQAAEVVITATQQLILRVYNAQRFDAKLLSRVTHLINLMNRLKLIIIEINEVHVQIELESTQEHLSQRSSEHQLFDQLRLSLEQHWETFFHQLESGEVETTDPYMRTVQDEPDPNIYLHHEIYLRLCQIQADIEALT